MNIIECSGVYPPLEDSFLLLDSLEVHPGERVLEMGCGTGLISVHMASAGAVVKAVDINPKAVACTKDNAERNGVAVDAEVSDFFSDVPGIFDMILFNPPYLAVQEDGDLEKAWSGGESGVEPLSRFLSEAPGHLRQGGSIILLVSSEMDRTALDLLLQRFRVEWIKSRRFFFEELMALRIRTE